MSRWREWLRRLFQRDAEWREEIESHLTLSEEWHRLTCHCGCRSGRGVGSSGVDSVSPSRTSRPYGGVTARRLTTCIDACGLPR
jgi:hypothetical protein